MNHARDFGRISTKSVQRIISGHTKAAGLEHLKISPHSFRHGVGKRAAAEQMYPPLLQQLLGHRNPGSSQVYYNIQNDNLRAEYHRKLGDDKISLTQTQTVLSQP